MKKICLECGNWFETENEVAPLCDECIVLIKSRPNKKYSMPFTYAMFIVICLGIGTIFSGMGIIFFLRLIFG